MNMKERIKMQNFKKDGRTKERITTKKIEIRSDRKGQRNGKVYTTENIKRGGKKKLKRKRKNEGRGNER
jgi:hypothetical protein